MSRRRGFTLIELLSVITVSSIFLGLATMLLHVMLSSERSFRQQAIADESAAQLAEALRRDVRAARDARIVGDETSPGSALALAYDNHDQVDYAVSGKSLTRTLTRDGKIMAREEFRFRHLSAAEFTIHSDDAGRVVTLELSRTKETSAPGQRVDWPPLRIDAVLASDHRYAGRPLQENQHE